MTEGDAANLPRRAGRDPSGTIRRIIDAARQEFIAHGFSGTKMEHIARRAQVSKQLVYIYYKSKDELYGEVLKVISRATYERLLQIDFDELDPEAAIRTYIGAVYDIFLADPAMAVVTLDQSLHGGAQIRLTPDVRRMHEALSKKLLGALERGHEAGVIGSHVDPSNLEFMTVIIVSGCVASRGMFTRHIGGRAFVDDSTEFWRDYAVSFILRALRA
jgi:AcrR family transcriptional regulator